MRRLIRLLVVLILIVAALWVGGEALLAREMRRLAAAGAGFAAQTVAPLREIGRIGVHMDRPALALPAGTVAAPGADLWISPLSPARLVLSLPQTLSLDTGGRPVALTVTDPQVSAGLRPLAGLAPGRLHIASGPILAEGRPLAERVAFEATSMPPQPDAPAEGRAAYRVDLSAAGLDMAGFSAPAPAGLAGPLAVTAQGVVWLDAAPTPLALASDAPPQPAGLRIDAAELRLGDISARALGRLGRDGQGRAEGAIALYTSDANRLIQAGADAGLIPESVRRLAGTMLRALSTLPLPAQAGGGAMDWPAAGRDELRLPILFSDGQMSLGPIPLGQAPLLRVQP